MVKIHQIHDKFFKRSLKEKKIAIDLIRGVVPPLIVKRINFSSLELTDKSLMLPRLEEIHCDVIYRCLIDEKEGYIFFLIEHNSTAVELMAFRKLEYLVNLMNQHLLQGHKKLPIVLPICLYHGKKSPYPYSTDIYDCFEDPILARELVFKPFQLIDLTIIPDDSLQQHGQAALMELLLKHYRRKDLANTLKKLLNENWINSILEEVNDSYLTAVLEYIGYSGEGFRPESGQELIHVFLDAFPNQQETIMNFAECLKQDGFQAGIEKGIQEGKEQERRQIALNLVRKGYPLPTILQILELKKSDMDQLLKELPA